MRAADLSGSSGVGATAAPTVAEVERICAVADPVVRNLQITQCYHELSAALAARLGAAANWCTFATWASKQAGQTMRQEDLPLAFARHAGISPGFHLALDGIAHDLIRHLRTKRDIVAVHAALEQALQPRAAFERAGDAVGRGNLKVFEEIGHAFADYLALFPAGRAPGAERIEHFCAELRPGDPPEGQSLLQQAFRRYHQAQNEPDGRARAELLFLANLEVGLHEQTRLQPEIAEALEAPVGGVEEVKRRLRQALGLGWLGRLRLLFLRLGPGPSPLDLAGERLRTIAQERARRAITDCLMTLELAGERLRLGRDLRAEFPESLRQLTNAELLALLARIDPTPDSVQSSGARDWAALEDRMHFIADLFRCYHEHPGLFRAPFTPEQVALLRAGKRPAGPL